MAIPKQCGMVPLTQNIEGLRSHALVTSIFMPEPEISPEARKWRLWLVHCLVKTARHYNDARNLVVAQIGERKRPASGVAKYADSILPLRSFDAYQGLRLGTAKNLRLLRKPRIP